MLDRVFFALSDPTRRSIVARLSGGQALGVGEVARDFSMSLPGVIKHLDVLTDAGLVTRTRVGRGVECRLAPAPMTEAVDWMERHLGFWSTRLDALEKLLEGESD